MAVWVLQISGPTRCRSPEDAGHRKKQQRLQHASQMRLLLEAMAPEDDDLECLGEDNGDSVWLWWVEKHLQDNTKATGTLAHQHADVPNLRNWAEV